MLKTQIILFLITIKLSVSYNCIEKENNCLLCNKETYLCDKCINDAFTPDNNGGCIGTKKCIIGENYCSKCNEYEDECEVCEDGYYPDNNGGCSYTPNCEISYKGECSKCKSNYILIGNRNDSVVSLKLCKSNLASDLKNCETINQARGICNSCKEGFYLNDKDFKCIQTKNCSTSIYGICTQCSPDFYLDKRSDKCILSENKFLYCKETLNGENCEICLPYYYLSQDKRCVRSNFCAKTNEYNCIECIQGYFMDDISACSNTDNCHSSDYETGICNECKEGYYLDLKDRKCKSNKNDEDFKFCKVVDEFCRECEKNYYLGEDNRCSSSKNCSQSENGECTICSFLFYLTKEKRCAKVEFCLHSNENYECLECEDNFYLEPSLKRCIEIDDGNFTNCKIADSLGIACGYCRDDYYLNRTDSLCYENNEYGKLYKCALTDEDANECIECINGYYLGKEDGKCVNTEGCIYSDDKHICSKCDEGFCLDLKNAKCEYNDEIDEESQKIFYKCAKTNLDATRCEICEEPFEVGEEGLCVNYKDCEESDGDKCLKCKFETSDGFYHYCLNKDYGCVETFFGGCLKCDNIFDLDRCNECLEGYSLNEYSKMCSKN